MTTDEPQIMVNGHMLTRAQAATVRVAIESFASDLVSNGLGDDQHGRQLAAAYLSAINTIRGFMFPPGS